MKQTTLLIAALVLAACQAAETPEAPPAPAAIVPADWCLSTAPEQPGLILTETRFIPASEVTPAQLAAIPPCGGDAPAEPL